LLNLKFFSLLQPIYEALYMKQMSSKDHLNSPLLFAIVFQEIRYHLIFFLGSRIFLK